MKTSGKLAFAVLAAVLLAPPAYPQNTNERLNTLMLDMINLKNQVRLMQESVDTKNAEVTRLLQEVLSRFTAIDANVTRLGDSIGNLKSAGDRSGADLADVRKRLTAVEGELGKVNEGLNGLQNQARGINNQIAAIKSAEEALPTPREMFGEGFAFYTGGVYDFAIQAFQDFLLNYPGDPNAPLAQIYIGDALSAQKRFEEALIEYDKALQNFPGSDKKCAALYKRGDTLVQLKSPDAKAAMNKTVEECPGTQEASNAAQDLKRGLKPRE